MAGTLQVNERAAWTPAGWIFNNVLERVALRIEADDPQLAEEVLEALGPSPGHLDLSAVPADRLQVITRATEEVNRKAGETGPKAFHDVAFFEPFMSELGSLLQILHADPRSGTES
ncbi:MAG TPA: hypothetical protein VL096_04680 [Pirellulaceae bacterium]|nr:hypothetical protein [Pirellulaceae bacterium]